MFQLLTSTKQYILKQKQYKKIFRYLYTQALSFSLEVTAIVIYLTGMCLG